MMRFRYQPASSRLPVTGLAVAFLALVTATACSFAAGDDDWLTEAPTERLIVVVEEMNQRLKLDPEDDDALHQLALAELGLGRRDDAVEHALQAVRLEPFVAEHLYTLGRTYESVGRNVRALTAYGQAIELDPDFIPAYVRYAQMQVALQERTHARETLREALRREPRHFAARVLQARLRLRDGAYNAALESVEAARTLDPQDAEALSLHVRILQAAGYVDAAVRLAEQGLQWHPESRALLAAWVSLHRERADWNAAARGLERIAQLGKLTLEERLLRIEVLFGQGRENAADTMLAALLHDAPVFAPARVRLAERLIRTGRPEEALRELRQAVAITPENPEAHYWSAVANHQLEEHAAGDAALAVAERLEPENPAVQVLQAASLLADYRLDAARPLLQRLQDRDPANPSVRLLQLKRATLEQDWQYAQVLLDELPPTFAPADVAFARLRLAYLQRNWKDVIQQSQTVPYSPRLRWRADYLRANALLRTGRRADALAIVTPYLEGERRRIEFFHLAGYLYLLEGDRVTAQRTFLAGLAFKPGHLLMIEGLSRMAMDAENWSRAQELLQRGLDTAGGYRALFLDRLTLVSQRRKDVQATSASLDRYLDISDPARTGGASEPASTVLYGSFFPDYDLRLAPEPNRNGRDPNPKAVRTR